MFSNQRDDPFFTAMIHIRHQISRLPLVNDMVIFTKIFFLYPAGGLGCLYGNIQKKFFHSYPLFEA